MLKSSDKSKFEDWTFHHGAKFLDKDISTADDKVALCSFPRAGSTLLRKLIEQCTAITTGSSCMNTLLQV